MILKYCKGGTGLDIVLIAVILRGRISVSVLISSDPEPYYIYQIVITFEGRSKSRHFCDHKIPLTQFSIVVKLFHPRVPIPRVENNLLETALFRLRCSPRLSSSLWSLKFFIFI